jgi:GT2 family glycosyltransferase
VTAVGVVVPAYREAQALDDLLTSLAAVEHPPEELHVVVAVDGADPATVAVARRHGVSVVPLKVNGGSYTARNAAVEALPGGLTAVLFTDADCVVTPAWVREHLRALEGAELSGGGVRFTYRAERPTPAEWVDSCRHLKQEAYVANDGYAATCNLGVRRDVLDRHRFDGRLRTGGDAEFCRRVVAAGAHLTYTPDALVEHPARDLRELVVKVRRIAGGVPGQAERWRHRQPPSTRLTLGIWRRARRAGHDVPLLTWGVPACLLDWFCTLAIARAVHRVQSAQRREAVQS